MTHQEVLQNCTVEGNIVKLPEGALDRKLYLEVATSLNLIGGKWKGGKVLGFVFPTDPSALLKTVAGGEKVNLKKEFQFFATPEDLADQLVALAELQPTDTILEPSAGQGAIIKAIRKVSDAEIDCYELMDVNCEILYQSELRFNFVGNDFLDQTGQTYGFQYSKIIANPPFTKNQDIEHVYEMYRWLRNGGRLVSVMSNSWYNGSQAKQKAFKDWLYELKADILDVEAGTFKESGTMVGAKIVVIDKPL